MSRSRRNVLPGYAHHVYQRGVRKEPLFHEDRDFLVYMRALKEGCVRHDVSIRTYTLMTNHIHLIAVPKNEDSLSRALHLAHTDYTMYFNAKYRFTGHAFERRPEMCAMDETYMWKAIRYVERNPLRAGMVIRAEDYLWSSAAAHCGLRDDILLDRDFPPPGAIENWSEWIQIPNTEEEGRELRLHTFSGSPWCTPEFLVQLETLTGRKLGPRKPGRPKKENRGQTGRLPFS
jgi:putative transposase